MILRTIDKLAAKRRVNILIAGVALCIALVFCFVVYPKLPASFHGALDPDQHGALGFGILRNHSLSVYPDTQPTVERGPVYPAFVALTLAVSRGVYPQCVQFGQCILFALQCLLVFWIAQTLWSRRAAVIAASAAACQPYLIWYLSRLRLEVPTMFLFTCIVAAALYFAAKPNIWRSALLGLALGVSALCRATLLPIGIIVPVLLLFSIDAKARKLALLSACLVVLVVAPWTVRNWRLTHTFIPVHVLAGVNMQIGDVVTSNYLQAPLSFDKLWATGEKGVQAMQGKYIPAYGNRWQTETARDKFYMADSLKKYCAHPGFFLKKVALGSVLFWFLGESPAKTALIVILNLPLLVLFCLSVRNVLRDDGFHNARLVPITAIALVYVMHLPVVCYARYSVILVPVMLAYAAGPMDSYLSRRKHEKPM